MIAQAHGGSAGARNVPGGGADVWLAVPTAAPSGADRQDGTSWLPDSRR
jgi:hypothetical protein